MMSSEIMPPGYNAPPNRKDRSDGYGGVLLATKGDIIESEIPIQTNAEIVATKVELVKQQPLVIISVYRPTNNDLDYVQELCQAIKQVATSHPTATIWLSGDFNLPDIDWDTEAIAGNQYSMAINNIFLNTFQD